MRQILTLALLLASYGLALGFGFNGGGFFGFNGQGDLWEDLAPSLSWSTNAYEFGSVNVGESATTTFTITNSGNDVAEGVATTVTGVGFSLYSTTTSGDIAAGATRTVKVRFTPTGAGAFTGYVNYTAANIARTGATLSGTGVAAGKPSAGTPLDLGDPLTASMIGAWPLNEGTGGPINNVTAVAGTATGSIWGGLGVQTTGATQYASVQNVQPVFPFTVAISGQVGSFAAQGLIYASANNSDGTAYSGVHVVSTTGGQIQFDMCNNLSAGSSGRKSFITTPTVSANTTFSFAAVCTSLSACTLYLNGASVATTTSGTASSYANTANAGSIGYLVANAIASSGTTEYVYVWNRALSASEVGQIHDDPWRIY